MDTHWLGVTEAREAIRAGRVGAQTYARACLEQIARHDSRVQAWAWLSPQRVLAAALACEGMDERLPLRGIPVGVKDIIATAGIPTEMGSPAFAGHVPARSATVVERLQAAGAFVMGKTVTAELAYFAPGKTRNPWNGAHTPGGSSSGSAAAVAAGFVPAALGTQTNGSVIRPAAYCGVVGFKPSAGLIPRTGIQPFSRTLDQVGVFARSIEDAALFASCLAGHDPQDPASRRDATLPVRITPCVTSPRLASVRSPVWPLADAVQQQSFEQGIARLRAAGAMVEEVTLDPLFDDAHAAQRTIMYAEAARELAALQAAHRAQLSARLNALIDEGRAISDDAVTAALNLRVRLQAALQPLWSRFDAIVTPPATGEAPATLTHTGDPTFCTIWTLCGLPAVNLPVARGPQGLPLGLQLVGADGDDATLLAAARWCVEALPWFEYPFD
jgi:Asp-tRNA(Asn)/Glu-tRNA(Gln) amidotransferase A subunit family amidase